MARNKNKKLEEKEKSLSRKKPKRRRVKTLSPLTTSPTSDCCGKAIQILRYSHESADALLKAYYLVRRQRGLVGGMTTDEEQDVLRAMLVMAAAGLDATTKQLIRDALPKLLECDVKAVNTYEKFIERRLGDETSETGKASANKFLARVLSRPSPQKQLIEEYIQHQTQGSLQSTSALYQVAATLGIEPAFVGINPNILIPIFETRNKIIHELDIKLDAPRRRRNLRSQKTMVRDTNVLIRIAEKIVDAVDKKIIN